MCGKSTILTGYDHNAKFPMGMKQISKEIKQNWILDSKAVEIF